MADSSATLPRGLRGARRFTKTPPIPEAVSEFGRPPSKTAMDWPVGVALTRSHFKNSGGTSWFVRMRGWCSQRVVGIQAKGRLGQDELPVSEVPDGGYRCASLCRAARLARGFGEPIVSIHGSNSSSPSNK
jgi:hypothetical protein